MSIARVVTCATLSLLSGTLAHAATAPSPKPVLTEDVNQPGRVPYQSQVAATTNCTSDPTYGSQCILGFDPVPDGYRLVITYVNISFCERSLDNQATFPGGQRVSLNSPFFMRIPLLSSNQACFVYGGTMQLYLDAGSIPYVEADDSSGFNFFGVTGIVVGYLVPR